MPGKVTPVVGYRMPGTAITFPVVRTGTATPEISQDGGGTTSGDFVYRRTSQGVVRWHKFDAGSTVANFDSAPQAGYDSLGPNYLSYAQGYTYGWQQPLSDDPLAQKPVIDQTTKSSGSGSMRIDIVEGSNAAQGFFIMHMSPDPAFGIGAGERVFVQWRQRISQAFYDTVVTSGGGEQSALKHVIVSSTASWGAHGDTGNSMQIVIATWQQHKLLSAFCDNLNADSVWLWDTSGGTQDWIQNQRSGCTRNAILYTPYPSPSSAPGCFPEVPNAWQTYQIEIDLRNASLIYVGNNRWAWDQSQLRLWGQNDGESSATLLIDWKPGLPGYFPLDAGEVPPPGEKYRTLWFDPQMTGKDTGQSHPPMSLWFDEIIVSTQKIPDAGSLPAWRNGYAVGTRGQIANTAQMSGYVFKTPRGSSLDDQVNAWAGYAFDGNGVWYSAANGGHSSDDHSAWQNMVLQIDFSQAAPRWTELDPGSDFADTTLFARFADTASMPPDGRPTTRHNYYATQYVSSAHTPDGKARIMLVGNFASWAEAADATWRQWTGSKYSAGPEVDGFRIADRAWDARARWQNVLNLYYGYPWACATDQNTGFIYVSIGGTLVYLDPSINVWTQFIAQSERKIDNWEYAGSMVDSIRKKLVSIMPSRTPHSSGSLRIERVGLAGYPGAGQVDTIPLQSNPANFAGFVYPMNPDPDAPVAMNSYGIVHNVDADRYWLFRTSNSADVPIVEINPDTGESRELTALLCPSNVGGNAPLARVAYLPTQGCVVYYARWADDIYFYPTR